MTGRPDFLPFGKPNFSDAEIAAVTRVLRSGWVGMGPETIAFENELAAAIGAPHVLAVNSCTSALFLSLLVSGVGPGDEVICPSLTWCSTANVVLMLGARPVFGDVDSGTLCVTAESVAAKLSPRTRAVVPVHFGGLAAPVGEIRAGLPDRVAIVEDAAHALGSRFRDGSQVGVSGNPACFSFYANKNLSTGEGGAVALFDEGMAERVRSLRLHALPADAWKRFSNPNVFHAFELTELGFKMNYTDLQACIGRVQLARQEEFRQTRLAVAGRYAERIADLPQRLTTQSGILDPGHARHLFTVLLPPGTTAPRRNEVVLALRARNIGASVHYPPLHEMPLYGMAGFPLPVTEDVCGRIMTLPISASMGIGDADDVMDAFLEALR